MALPGFTAEAGVGPATQVYRTPQASGIEATVVSPQSMGGNEGVVVGGLGAEDLGIDDLGAGDFGTEGLEDDDLGGDGLEGEGLEDDEMLVGDETEIEGVG